MRLMKKLQKAEVSEKCNSSVISSMEWVRIMEYYSVIDPVYHYLWEIDALFHA